jgi:hypothetical protein
MRVHWIVAAELLLSIAGAVTYYYWPQSLEAPAAPVSQVISRESSRTAISWPGRVFVAKVGEFDSVLPAYLMFDYLRSHDPLRDMQVLLTGRAGSGQPPYTIWVHLPDDVLTGVEESAVLRENPLLSVAEQSWVTAEQFTRDLRETDSFIQAYNSADYPILTDIRPDALQIYVRQFICFKATVDPRTWPGNPFPLSRPSPERAEDLAGDIVQLATFYQIPVDVLLGIGAMENNFLNAPGDLNNAIWKNNVERDDIVIRQRGHKAWVLNSSIGTWQITRQSLRHAHELFLCDTRDYSKLPLEFRPTQELDMNFLSSRLLTTYAALLLRELLDYFDGNAFLATAAYNGSKQRPNLNYAGGVENVASYARRVIGNTARLNGTVEPKPVMLPVEPSRYVGVGER